MNPSDKPNLPDLRVSYELGELPDDQVPTDPFVLFDGWLQDAVTHQLPEPNAMTLCTLGLEEGLPTSRTVLLKGRDNRGFHFYTNYQSRKGRELEANPRSAITFLWTDRQRQVSAKGMTWKLPHEEAQAYFASRPRGHQIGAWASEQSQTITSREVLEQRSAELEKLYEGKEIPCPPHWGGYALMPDEIEFWQGRRSRLHDRIRFVRDAKGWRHFRLAP